MDIKEQIHGLTEEMLTNLGRLVAIDSQLGTPAEDKPFGEGPAKALEEGLKIAQELGFKTVNLDNYCGYAEMGEGDEIVGIDADIAQAICDKLGYELEIDDMEFDAILAAVQSGKADFGAAGMTVTEDRLESVDFTDTYANASQVIIVKAD